MVLMLLVVVKMAQVQPPGVDASPAFQSLLSSLLLQHATTRRAIYGSGKSSVLSHSWPQLTSGFTDRRAADLVASCGKLNASAAAAHAICRGPTARAIGFSSRAPRPMSLARSL